MWHLWPVWFTGDAHLATVATVAAGVVGSLWAGTLPGRSLAVVLGVRASAHFSWPFIPRRGRSSAFPQMIQSRPQFGYRGALLVWGVALIAYIGFNAFNQILAAQTLHALYRFESMPTMLAFTLLAVSFGGDRLRSRSTGPSAGSPTC